MFGRRLALIVPLVVLTACSLPMPNATAAPGGATLAAYRSEEELTEALARWRAEAEKRRPAMPRGMPSTALSITGSAAVPAPAPAMAAAPAAAAKPAAPGTAAAEATADAAGITNVQTAGVDEGGIVKRAGEHLVILRRGRLFTVRVGGDALQPVSVVEAYAPGSNPQGAWYDELLVSGSTVVVVGYSYARGGTEIGLFELGVDGSLTYRATHHLRGFDYYSSRNYASRLIGRTLVFYSPTQISPWGPAAQQMFPGWRRWQGQGAPAEFQRILPATRVYRTDDEFDPGQPLALHTVTACELAGADMRCKATSVLGPVGRVFYVSGGSVYVWTSSPPPRAMPGRPVPEGGTTRSAVFRIPLDGSAPTGLKTTGVPVDQFSFLEDTRDHLNVLVREAGDGEGMWGSERAGGRLALLRVPLRLFGDGRGAAQREHYRLLPEPLPGPLQNRYVGDWLLWGTPAGAGALRYAEAGESVALSPGHAVERIEALGRDAVLVGNRGADLVFTSVRLSGREATLAGRFEQEGARQGETRSHGFFYRPTGADEGLLGLPLLSDGGPRRPGVYSDIQGSARVFYLRQRDLTFTGLGALAARAETPRADGCKASCVDWYGNARPIFLGERVFALMGYELVEGQLEGRGARERIAERRRVNFGPAALAGEGRGSPFN